MSRTVPKTFKRPTYYLQGNLSNATSPQQSSSYFPQHLSLDLSKEKDLITPLKDVNPHSTTSQTSIKKLGLLLDPHKDRSLAAQVMTSTTGSSMHASPKSLLEVSKKFSKLKSTNTTNTSGEFALISPKDLVRKAMSKLKTKENNTGKPEMLRTASATSKNFRKSLSLRFTPQLTDKKEETLKTLSPTYEENLPLTRTTSTSNKEKAAKLRRMKKIYNDDLLRLSRSNTYSSPQESMHLWTETGTPNKSLSGGMWSVMVSMPNSTTNKGAKQYFGTMTHTDLLEKQKIRSGSKHEKSHKKVGSLDQLDLRPKEYKTSLKTRNHLPGQKSVEMRKYRTEHNKAVSMSFNHSRVGSQFTINAFDANGRPNSPLLNQNYGEIVQEESQDTEILLTDEGTLSMEQRDVNDLKGKAGSINELKNWTNNLPLDEEKERKANEAANNVRHAQETMLEKLRDALGNEEFVKREEYERVVHEKRELEEIVDLVREENEKLRAFFIQLKNSGWGQHQEGSQGLKELVVKQQKELEVLKRREGAVKNVLKLIYQTGMDVNEFMGSPNDGNGNDDEQLFTETQYTEEADFLNTEITAQLTNNFTDKTTAKYSNYSLGGPYQEESMQKSEETLSEIMTTEGKAMSEIKEDNEESSSKQWNC